MSAPDQMTETPQPSAGARAAVWQPRQPVFWLFLALLAVSIFLTALQLAALFSGAQGLLAARHRGQHDHAPSARTRRAHQVFPAVVLDIDPQQAVRFRIRQRRWIARTHQLAEGAAPAVEDAGVGADEQLLAHGQRSVSALAFARSTGLAR